MKEQFELIYNSYIKPYIMAIKVALLIGLFAFGWVASCSHYKNSSAQVDAETAAEIATLRKANYDYEQSEKLRKQQLDKDLAEAKKVQEAAQAAARRQKARADSLAESLEAIGRKQKEAARDPKCRELMEQEVCPALR